MMIALDLITREIKKRPFRSFSKIAFLSVGFAVAIVLITKAFYQQSYDNFYLDKERIYRIQSVYIEDGKLALYPNVSGGIPPLLAKSIPGIEKATRIANLGRTTFKTKDDNKAYGISMLADENYFDVLPLPMIVGDAKSTLSRPDYALVSESMAEKLGGDVIGKQFADDYIPDVWFTIGGVFEDIPSNSHRKFDVIISLESIGRFMWDGRANLDGNDRYRGYIKLNKDVDIASFRALTNKMLLDIPELKETKEQSGFNLSFDYLSLTDIYDSDPDIRRSIVLLLMISILVLFAVVMNYYFLLFSDIPTKQKHIGICKCYGASHFNIISYSVLESFIYVFVSILGALFLLLTIRGEIEGLLAIQFHSIFNTVSNSILVGIFLFIILLTGGLTGYMSLNMSVKHLFKSFQLRNRWKKYLLAFQFTITSLMIISVVFINMQYRLMLTDDPGYAMENLAYVHFRGDTDTKASILEAIKEIAGVDKATYVSTLPFTGFSGNDVSLIEDPNNALFNIADQYYISPDYFELMEVPIVAGANFNKGLGKGEEIIVSESFVDYILNYTDWKDGVVGKKVYITEHGVVKICGVYKEYRLGLISGRATKPSVLFYGGRSDYGGILLIKFHTISTENMKMVSAVLKNHIPQKTPYLRTYKSDMISGYRDTKNETDMIVIASLITLFISFFGLVLYLHDEINFRRSELALRKINGAQVKDVLSLFIKDILFIAIPSVFIGIVLSYYLLAEWLKQFSEKIDLSWYVFTGLSIVIIAVVIGFVSIFCLKVSHENPVKSMRND